MLDALVAFDERAKPVGLYAPEELDAKFAAAPRFQADWELVLTPTLLALGSVPEKKPSARQFQEGRFGFVTPEGLNGWLQVVRQSKIKVRRYGDTYRVDPHHDFSKRWERAAMKTKLSALDVRRQRFAQAVELLLFIGFATEPEPYAAEFAALEAATKWTRKAIGFTQRIWADPYNRKFNTLAALWAHESTVNWIQ